MVGGIKNGKTKPINRDCICFFILYNLLRLDSLDHQPLYKLIYIFIVSCLYFFFFKSWLLWFAFVKDLCNFSTHLADNGLKSWSWLLMMI